MPADGVIPAGAEYLERPRTGRIVHDVGACPVDADNGVYERRLIDPPTPVVSYTQRLALELENAGWIRAGGAEGVAEHLDALGVRAPEEER